MSSRRPNPRHAASTAALDELHTDIIGIDDLSTTIATPVSSSVETGALDSHSHSRPLDDGLGASVSEFDDPSASETEPVVGSNVRVVVRVRPLLSGELTAAHSTSLLRIDGEIPNVQAAAPTNSEGDGLEESPSHARNSRARDWSSGHISIGVKETHHAFKFDAILTPHHHQTDVYEAGHVERMLQALLKGFNSTIFAYGQTVRHKTKRRHIASEKVSTSSS